SEYLQVEATGAIVPTTHTFKNYPYYTYYRRSGNTISMVMQGGDGSPNYSASGWGIQAGDDVTVSYIRIIDAYSGESPFYDPYTSELPTPNLVQVKFDTLVSGYYRVSIVDARDVNRETVVAWLTEPSD